MIFEQKISHNTLILSLKGRMDVKGASEVEDSLKKVILENHPLDVLLNLEEVEYMSSSGLRIFVSIMRILSEKNRKMKMCNLSQAVIKVFEVVELMDMFRIYHTEEEALQS